MADFTLEIVIALTKDGAGKTAPSEQHVWMRREVALPFAPWEGLELVLDGPRPSDPEIGLELTIEELHYDVRDGRFSAFCQRNFWIEEVEWYRDEGGFEIFAPNGAPPKRPRLVS